MTHLLSRIDAERRPERETLNILVTPNATTLLCARRGARDSTATPAQAEHGDTAEAEEQQR
jgi:hypothetical protein